MAPNIKALLNSPAFTVGCQSVIVGAFWYWDHKRQQARSAKQKQKDDEWNREFKKRQAERDQKFDDWERKLKQDEAEWDREWREARYAFSKHFRENSQLICANLATCANLFEFERVFREWKEQQHDEATDSL